MERKVKRLLVYSTGTLFLICICTICPLLFEAYTSGTWPTVKARIVSSSISADAPGASDAKYFLDIVYEYQVGDLRYSSTNYGTQARLSSRSEKEMVEKKVLYPEGSEISIAYDPEDETYSRIQRGFAWYHWAGLFSLLITAGMFLASVLTKTKEPLKEEGFHDETTI